MRKISAISLVAAVHLFLVPWAFAQVSSSDYVITRTHLDAAGTKYLDAVQYYDGAGFPTQLLSKKVTPSQTNLFTLQTYDSRGRESRSYLPAEKSAGTLFLSSSDIASWSAAGYSSDNRPYGEKGYEPTAVGRPVSEQGPGSAWSGHAVTTAYGSNAATGALACKRYIVLSDGSLSDEGTQPSGTLHTTSVTDEDGTVTIVFADSFGRTVLSRVMNGTQTLDTYTVYDGHGNVRYVLEPMYQESADLSKYAFVYTYDVRDRVVSEQKPGCAAVQYWYDKGGRLTFSQDGVQSSAGVWTFHLWDNRGREVLRGVCTKSSSDESAVASSVVTVSYSSSTGICGSGYSTSLLSLPNATLLEAVWYDGYAFLDRTGYTDRSVFPSASGSVSTNGLPTGRLSAVLGSSSLVRSATYYDTKGRAVKIVTTNLKGGSETETVSYTYTDQPSSRGIVHTATGLTTLTESYGYSYDHADRLTGVTHQVGSGSAKTILSSTYDVLGRLSTETFEGNTASRRTYIYDIRSQVTGISAGSSGALFSESVGYNSGPGTARYGGAPSSVLWKVSGESSYRGYTLSYDGAGRLTGATYGTSSSASGTLSVTNDYTESVTGYDRNGNVTSLQRYGKLSGGSYGLIDNLSIVLSGNRLQSVSDAVTGAAASGNTAFTDGASSQTEYTYDADGRLGSDANKGITSITYNALGLPSGVSVSSGIVSWLYDGSGRKLRRTDGSTVTDYVGNAVYTGSTLTMLQIPNGYVTFSGTSPTYHYYQKDHLGSNRMVTSASGTVEQVVHYYPFGGQFADGTAASLQEFKFTGKEWDGSKGQNLYDFGARTYDPALLRWTTPDPLSSKYPAWSPYAYCGNSPVLFVDPDGKRRRLVYNQRKNTITVQANIYYYKHETDLVDKGLAIINQQTASYTDESGRKYLVSFEIVGKAISNAPDYSAKRDDIGNVIELSKNNPPQSKKGGVSFGTTKGNKSTIYRIEDKYIPSVVAHEIGHLLGAAKSEDGIDRHSETGLMVENIYNETFSLQFDQQNINDIIEKGTGPKPIFISSLIDEIWHIIKKE